MPEADPFWDGFGELHFGREAGVSGPEPIRLAEIEAWLNLEGVRSATLRRRWKFIIRGMDAAYLKWCKAKRAATAE